MFATNFFLSKFFAKDSFKKDLALPIGYNVETDVAQLVLSASPPVMVLIACTNHARKLFFIIVLCPDIVKFLVMQLIFE
ncbi:19147_t:CDS:2 [Cetraspora pellucida]|uniref:19147_t:CDS:1 n=1 Tax=Cetraspora pellucida TaxID=1433469 RepID=A0A9N9A6Q0_9GLOM|nr:19147_t:CDS:2 [Cetraspora pellucida]